MDTTAFLKKVLPEEGQYILAMPAGKGFIHHGFSTVENLTRCIAARVGSDPDGTIYYATASFSDLDSVDTGAKLPKNSRTGAKANRKRAFYFDIDIKPLDDHYHSVPEAMEALKRFVRTTGLPVPVVVSSGGGLHVYWPMEESITVEQWRHYAAILSSVAEDRQFLVDAQITTDVVRVLRPPGTFNTKTDERRPVVVRLDSPATPTRALLAKIAQMGDILGTAPKANKPAAAKKSIVQLNLPGQMLDFSGSLVAQQAIAETAADNAPDADPKLICTHCPQLKAQALAMGKGVHYAQWYDMVGCMRFAKDGERAVHLLSKGHPNYAISDTNAKIDSHKDGGAGPTTCAQFERNNPSGCAGCKFKGTVTTPLQLGRPRYEEAPTPRMSVVDAKGEEVMHTVTIPAPYKRLRLPNGNIVLSISVEDANGTVHDRVICDHDIYITQRSYDEQHKCFKFTLAIETPMDGVQFVDIEQGMLAKRQEFQVLLYNKGVDCPIRDIDHVVSYLSAYIRELKSKFQANTVHAQFGFTANYTKFVLPEVVVNSDGCYPAPGELHRQLRGFEPMRGDADAVRDLLSHFGTAGRENMQAIIGLAAGSPLFHLAGPAKGGVVNIFGPPGTGKSLTTSVGMSLWGTPKAFNVQLRSNRTSQLDQSDTSNSFYSTVGLLRHVPAMFDEVTNTEAADFASISMAMERGMGKSRAKADGTIQEQRNGFANLLFCTSNESMLGKFSTEKHAEAAQYIRTMEFGMPLTEHSISKEEGLVIGTKLEACFGAAGPMLAQFYLKHIVKVREKLAAVNAYVSKRCEATSQDRFWPAYAATAVVAVEVMNTLGLTNYDTKALADWFVDTILHLRLRKRENSRGSAEVVEEYLRVTRAKNTLVVRKDGVNGGPPQVVADPTDGLLVRVEEYNNLAFLSQREFTTWLIKNQHDSTEIRKNLEAMGILVGRNKQVTLGRGTPWATAQVRCSVLNLELLEKVLSE